MKTNDMFPSDYIQAKKDLVEDGQPVDLAVEITGFETVIFDNEDQEKYVLLFGHIERKLILNKTNYNTMLDLHPADDTDEWVGAKITLFAAEVQYMGKTTWGTRIRLTVPKEVGGPPAPENFGDTEEIPF